MNLQELRGVADQNGIEYPKTFGVQKMQNMLSKHGIPINATGPEVGQEPDTEADHVVEDGPVIDEPEIMNEKPLPPIKDIGLEASFKAITEEYKAQSKSKEKNNHLRLGLILKKLEIVKAKIKANGMAQALHKVLGWERSRKVISVKDEYYLNEVEAKEDLETCTCKNQIASGRHCKLGETYKFKKHYDEDRQKDVYRIFVPREVPPEAQITKELSWKINQGFLPEQKDYLPTKILWHCFSLVETEFDKYFEVND